MSRFPFRAILADAGAEPDLARQESALAAIGAAMGLPHIGLIPDIARPYYSAEADGFFRRHGWPDELLRIWWEKQGSIRTALYIRCRLTSFPFLVSIGPQSRRRDASLEEREMEQLFLRHGLTTLVAVPIHLPRGQIALIVFAGSAAAADLKGMLEEGRPDLIAAGYLAMQAWNEAHGPIHAIAEELSRLTPREWDCLRLLAQGCRDAEIARLNGIAATTVRYHVDNVVRKLGAVNRVHAVALACQLGIVGPLVA